mmetsp:Transcript_96705/g.301139  ORF Transcript_96705/g.301139 Transcript_96705/m.301139 type:complete len:234 (+) Transcript_96705:1058-1759(+)
MPSGAGLGVVLDEAHAELEHQHGRCQDYEADDGHGPHQTVDAHGDGLQEDAQRAQRAHEAEDTQESEDAEGPQDPDHPRHRHKIGGAAVAHQWVEDEAVNAAHDDDYAVTDVEHLPEEVLAEHDEAQDQLEEVEGVEHLLDDVEALLRVLPAGVVDAVAQFIREVVALPLNFSKDGNEVEDNESTHERVKQRIRQDGPCQAHRGPPRPDSRRDLKDRASTEAPGRLLQVPGRF